VGLKRKGLKKRVKRRVMEDVDKGLIAPLELSDRVMEQVEVMVKELQKISGGIWALVEGVGRLMEVVVEKKEVRKVDKEMEMEEVQKMDKQTETEEKEEDSEEEEESKEEEEKEKKGVDREESKGESNGMEDRKIGEKK
jgi:hypothetical protein